MLGIVVGCDMRPAGGGGPSQITSGDGYLLRHSPTESSGFKSAIGHEPTDCNRPRRVSSGSLGCVYRPRTVRYEVPASTGDATLPFRSGPPRNLSAKRK